MARIPTGKRGPCLRRRDDVLLGFDVALGLGNHLFVEGHPHRARCEACGRRVGASALNEGLHCPPAELLHFFHRHEDAILQGQPCTCGACSQCAVGHPCGLEQHASRSDPKHCTTCTTLLGLKCAIVRDVGLVQCLPWYNTSCCYGGAGTQGYSLRVFIIPMGLFLWDTVLFTPVYRVHYTRYGQP